MSVKCINTFMKFFMKRLQVSKFHHAISWSYMKPFMNFHVNFHETLRCASIFHFRIEQKSCNFWLFSWNLKVKMAWSFFQIFHWPSNIRLLESVTIILMTSSCILMKAWNFKKLNVLKKIDFQYLKYVRLIIWQLESASVNLMKAPCNIWKLAYSNQKCVIWYISNGKFILISFKFNISQKRYTFV